MLPANIISKNGTQYVVPGKIHRQPVILFITSYPPRECGIATYSQDLIKALNSKFKNSFSSEICALESGNEKYQDTDEIQYTLNTTDLKSYTELAEAIHLNTAIKMVVIQHEFGFFDKQEGKLIQFLNMLEKPAVMVFHTVLPNPDEHLKQNVQNITARCQSIIVMTRTSEKMLVNDYAVPQEKITVISHGTHLVPHLNKEMLKEKYGLSGRKVLSTFGLLSSGKGIETTLEALPSIVGKNPEVVFLIIGKTHPTIIKQDGEKYRSMLESMVTALKLQNHVKFINYYLPLSTLLEYLQLTDIYLFTSKDPNQAVSGTFSYALSCGCPVISTPIPHTREVLGNGAGIIIDFGNTQQLSETVNRLFNDKELIKNMGLNALHRIAPTAWENAAVAHTMLFEKITEGKIRMQYSLPEINLDHLKRLTTDFGMIQFCKINQPDIDSGYTLDDNARALIAMCQHYELTGDKKGLIYINTYFNFIKYCLQPEGYFLNYVNAQKAFTAQNNVTNLADAHGRAIWALGYLVSMRSQLPEELVTEADAIMQQAVLRVNTLYSTRALGFIIKGLYYYNTENKTAVNGALIKMLANRLVQMYKHESGDGWDWFESYLTYANSILPEALLCVYMVTGELIYKDIAKASFDFLLSHTFDGNNIKVISNKSWLQKGEKSAHYGEQPIDVAYSIFALGRFYDMFEKEVYLQKMEIAFSWFLGNNHLHQIIYNPGTGGCYDGLEEDHVNLNQGAESTVSYLMARLTVEKHFGPQLMELEQKYLPKQHSKPNKLNQLV